MKVFRKGKWNYSNPDERHRKFVVIMDDTGYVTWYYPKSDNRPPSVGSLDPTRNEWAEDGSWIPVRMSKALKVALRLCAPEDIYDVVMAYSKPKVKRR